MVGDNMQSFSYANRGMYLEELINKTIDYYSFNKIAFFEKRFLPIKITQKLNDNLVQGKLMKKSYVDYCGVYEGKYISFEAKQTNNDYFLLSQIKEHQIKHIVDINNFKGISFLVIHFFNESKTFLVTYQVLEKWIANHKNKIDLKTFEKQTIELQITFPGILDFISVINKIGE